MPLEYYALLINEETCHTLKLTSFNICEAFKIEQQEINKPIHEFLIDKIESNDVKDIIVEFDTVKYLFNLKKIDNKYFFIILKDIIWAYKNRTSFGRYLYDSWKDNYPFRKTTFPFKI